MWRAFLLVLLRSHSGGSTVEKKILKVGTDDRPIRSNLVTCLLFRPSFESAMGNKWMCGSADVWMWQRVKDGQNLQMLSADVWVEGGCADNSCHVHYQS